jgi:serine/threonine-protein kinase GIN4
VEDARQNFASADMTERPLPPLPVSPMSRSTSHSRANRSNRIPRKILAASQIFAHDPDHEQSMSTILTSTYATADNINLNDSLPLPIAGESHLSDLVTQTPRARRATVSALSEPINDQYPVDADKRSPSNQAEKPKFQANLIRHITSVSRLDLRSRQRE